VWLKQNRWNPKCFTNPDPVTISDPEIFSMKLSAITALLLDLRTNNGKGIVVKDNRAEPGLVR
jgi:hypothetical protein